MLTDSLLAFDNLRHRMLVIANAHVGKTDPAFAERALEQPAPRHIVTHRANADHEMHNAFAFEIREKIVTAENLDA